MKDDKVYIEQILEAIHKIKDFTVDMDGERFYQDQKTQSAVIMQLTLIGELVKRLSDDTKTNIDLPWKEIAGFRDRAIHDYFRIDLQVVWDTVLEDLDLIVNKLK